jgi:Rod binding domain-containing protein
VSEEVGAGIGPAASATLLASRPVLGISAANADGETPAQRKLRQAAGEFESMLLSSLWKSMKSSFEGDETEFSDPAHEALDDWGMQAMCGAVGKTGGLGIAKMILKHLEPKLPGAAAPEGGTGD